MSAVKIKFPTLAFTSKFTYLYLTYDLLRLYAIIGLLCTVKVYGKHAGHKCELATDIATTTREELRSWSKKLGESYDLVKKSRKKVIDTKDSIVNTQQYVRGRIMKHMGVLNACMRRREVILKCDVDDKTKQKLQLLDAQER